MSFRISRKAVDRAVGRRSCEVHGLCAVDAGNDVVHVRFRVHEVPARHH